MALEVSILNTLKFNLQESKFPYFSDEDLETLYTSNNSDIKKASYQGCLIKAQDDSMNLGPISSASNEKYWLRRARSYSSNATGSIKRVDEL